MISVVNESFLDRLAGVITLKRPVYETLQRDPAATTQAWLIIVFLGLANGIALVTTPLIIIPEGTTDEVADTMTRISATLTFDTTERQVMALLLGVIGAVISWYLSSWLFRVIGNLVAAREGGKVSAPEMRRLVGWGYSPSLAAFFSPIPVLGPLLALAGTLWAFVTGIMALRAAFDIGIWKAIAIAIAAFFVILLVVMVIAFITVVLTVPSA